MHAAHAARHFAVSGTLEACERFGSGLINDTYRVECVVDGIRSRYVLQRINASVFKRPDQVMENIETVTAHIAKRLRAEGGMCSSAVSLSLVPVSDGHMFFVDDSGSYWRMFRFIGSGVVFDTVQDEQHAYEVGRCLGRFQSLVSDLAPGMLHDTLPGFHHTQTYLNEYDDAMSRNSVGRSHEVHAESTFVSRRRQLAPMLTGLLQSGAVPLRVVHNDPKVNNVMIDKVSRTALCMLDLDTVKAGTVLFDFGDCVRSAANPAGEDSGDLTRVNFDMVLFRAITRGYLHAAGDFLTQQEREMLPMSVQVITFELGIRFLADYLRGDDYFRVAYPGHNLHRARVQFRLLESMESSAEQMVKICKEGK